MSSKLQKIPVVNTTKKCRVAFDYWREDNHKHAGRAINRLTDHCIIGSCASNEIGACFPLIVCDSRFITGNRTYYGKFDDANRRLCIGVNHVYVRYTVDGSDVSLKRDNFTREVSQSPPCCIRDKRCAILDRSVSSSGYTSVSGLSARNQISDYTIRDEICHEQSVKLLDTNNDSELDKNGNTASLNDRLVVRGHSPRLICNECKKQFSAGNKLRRDSCSKKPHTNSNKRRKAHHTFQIKSHRYPRGYSITNGGNRSSNSVVLPFKEERFTVPGGFDPICSITMDAGSAPSSGITPKSGLDTECDNPIYVTWINCRERHRPHESVVTDEALFGGQLSGRQYKDVRINPLFLEGNTNDDVTLDVNARSKRHPEKSVHIDLQTAISRRNSTPDIASSDQHDSGVSSDISSGDSQVGQATSPVIRNVERNDCGEIVLTLNKTPNNVNKLTTNSIEKPQRGVRTANSFRVHKDFGAETRMVINGNNISFVKDLNAGRNDFIEETLHTNNQNFIRTDLSYDKESVDGDYEDHYQTIDTVILPDPLDDPDTRGDNDTKSDNSDELSQLYAQVRKGPKYNIAESVTPLYTSTIIVDGNGGDESGLSSQSLNEDVGGLDVGAMTLNSEYKSEAIHDNGKLAAGRSLSASATDSQHKSSLIRAYSDGNANDFDLPEYWNPNKMGKRRKKNRLNYTKQQVDASPTKELKSILVCAPSNSRVFDDSTSRSTSSPVTQPTSHSSLSEQKSVKFSDDTIDNEHKTKHYRQEVIDFSHIHRQQNGTDFDQVDAVFIDEVPFDASFSWPAQPRDNFIIHNSYHNNNIQNGKDPSKVPRCVCSTCCSTCMKPIAGTILYRTDTTPNMADGHVTTANNTFDGGGSHAHTVNGQGHVICSNSGQRVECQSCLQQRRKQHLQRRRSFMRWSLLVFLIVIVVGLVIGLAVYFGTKTR